MDNTSIYSIKNGSTAESEYQLDNLGDQLPYITIGGFGRTGKYDWDGPSPGTSQTFFRSTTSEDYDKVFADRLYKIKPPYHIDSFLDYHFNYYIQKGQNMETFLKHMKYVIVPMVAKMRESEIYITLLNEWINKKYLS